MRRKRCMMIGALAMTLLSACADNNLGTDRENQSFQNKIRKKIQIYIKMS